MSSCPMTKDVPLTDKQVERFCSFGCSVICKEELSKMLERKRGKSNEGVRTHKPAQGH